MKVAAYARYSSEQQSAASLDDQLRNCRAYAERMGWPAPVAYTDAAISGARADRPGYQRLLQDAHRFNVILLDDLSRLSRDNVEVQQQVRRLKFAGVRVIAVSDAIDTDDKGHKLGVGLRGLMGELYLDDLREKTHRGLAGRALQGASGGGLGYGYRVTEVGQRAIDEAQATIVRRIFAEYIEGRSPREIAIGLNRDGVPSPRGGTWANSAIYGDKKRGIGILSNQLYVGRQVWNRSRWIKHPDTGRKVRQERPPSEWIVTDIPDLAIIDVDTWQRAQARMQGTRRDIAPRAVGRQPSNLLSGLLVCEECGGPFVVIDRYNYGCNIHKDRGPPACGNKTRLRRAAAETALLAGIKDQLLTEEAFQLMQREVQRALKDHAPDTTSLAKRLQEAERVRENVMAAIRAGIITPSTKAELERAEAAAAAAAQELAAAKRFTPSTIVPRLRERWREAVDALAQRGRDIPKARAAIRELLGEKIIVRNEKGDLIAEIASSSDAQITVVAGAGFGRYLRNAVRIKLASAAHSRG